jgi:hypothetical protein
MAFAKGARVTIVHGRTGKGVSGTVFWTGPNKYGSGERLGLRGDDGETYWSTDEDVEAATGAPPVLEAGPSFNKGDRVAFTQGGLECAGTVFWTGDSRNGPGQRIGIKDDANPDEAVWLDSRQARALTDEPLSASPAPRASATPSRASSEDDDGAVSIGAPISLDELPEPPPMDDGYADQWADEDDDAGW